MRSDLRGSTWQTGGQEPLKLYLSFSKIPRIKLSYHLTGTMPPIPTALDAESLALIESIERHHNDLSTFQIPRLRACTGPLVTQQAWAAEVREDIEGLARQVEVCLLDSFLYLSIEG